MALHKVKIKKLDGTSAAFFENPDGTWEYRLDDGKTLNWFSCLSTQLMISTMCAAADLGATITIEKSEDN